jgi:hypothetical protein
MVNRETAAISPTQTLRPKLVFGRNLATEARALRSWIINRFEASRTESFFNGTDFFLGANS